MGKVDVLKETTPLSSEDCFLVMQRPKSGFNFPLHVHMEFELNYLENAAGAIRIVGDSVEEIDDLDLVLIAGGTKHAYSNHKCPCNGIFEITIQFHKSLFDSLINRRHFKTMKDMFDNASSGLVFSREMILGIQDKLRMLSNDNKPDSFKNLLRLVEILKILSLDKAARRLNAVNTVKNYNNNDTDRLDSIMLYLHENYQTEKFKEELNIRNRDAMTEQVEGAQPGEGALNDILDGIMDVFSVDSEDRKGEADGTPDEEENATAPAAEQPERQ